MIPSILLALKKCYFEKVLLWDPVNTVNLEKKRYFEKGLLCDPVNTATFDKKDTLEKCYFLIPSIGLLLSLLVIGYYLVCRHKHNGIITN